MKKLTLEQMKASLEAIMRDIAAQDATTRLPNYEKLTRSAEKLREGIQFETEGRAKKRSRREQSDAARAI